MRIWGQRKLLESAPLRRKLLKHQIKEHSGSEQSDLDQTSKAEVDLGDLQGPFSGQQITNFFGSEEWILNPRFPIYQGESKKVRIIDDCKMSGMNAAFQRTFGVKPMDIDVLAAAAASIAKATQDGEIDGSKVHPGAKKVWLGGTLALSRAYKQVRLSPKSRRFCVLGFMIDGDWVYYRSEVLPFGASASVFAFIRISRSIHHILCVPVGNQRGLLRRLSHHDAGTRIECPKERDIVCSVLAWVVSRQRR